MTQLLARRGDGPGCDREALQARAMVKEDPEGYRQWLQVSTEALQYQALVAQ